MKIRYLVSEAKHPVSDVLEVSIMSRLDALCADTHETIITSGWEQLVRATEIMFADIKPNYMYTRQYRVK
jgi:hypothetical protein